MQLNNKSIAIIFFFSTILLSIGCKEEKINLYDEPYAINFGKLKDKSGTMPNLLDPAPQSIEVNFALLPIFNQQTDTLQIPVQLMGKIPDKPLKIVFTTIADADYSLAKVAFKEDGYRIDKNKYAETLPIYVDKPLKADTEYRAILTFNYQKSDVEAGADYLQKITLKVTDKFTLQDAQLTMDDWNTSIAPKIGAYSNVKLRFIAYAFRKAKPEPIHIGYLKYLAYYPQYVEIIENELIKYNEAHPDNPLKDENGNIVTFTKE